MTGGFALAHLAGAGAGLALGLLVGIQRGWSMRNQAAGTRFAGIRTFGLFGLAGGLAGTLYAHAQGPALVLLGGAAALIVAGYARASVSSTQISGTTGIAGLLTLASGFAAAAGEMLLGTAIAVTMVLLLSLRGRLHEWLRHLTEQEVLAIARFALIAAVILPLLPDRGFGPYAAWNLRQLWLVVVLVSGFSFAGYVAAKRLGASRASIATAAAGAMVSSTAVTAGMATHMRGGAADWRILAAAISVAQAVMILRVLVLVSLLARFALVPLATLIVPAALVSLIAVFLLARRAGREAAQEACAPKLRNPFDLFPALLLAAMVMLLTLVAHGVLERFGDHGLAVVLAISGTIDVDSAIITLGSLPRGAIGARAAGLALAAPVLLNTLFKGGVTIGLCGWREGRRGALPLFASAAAILVAGAFALIP